MRAPALLVIAATVLAGCYHATIETGRTPGPTVVEETFAASWVYGLVPPKTMNVAERCPSGVARVETEHSFVNQLVGLLTLGIYTPIHIKATCAASGSARATPEPGAPLVSVADFGSPEEALASALRLAADSGRPVYLDLGAR